jgi:hypothetical protein
VYSTPSNEHYDACGMPGVADLSKLILHRSRFEQRVTGMPEETPGLPHKVEAA